MKKMFTIFHLAFFNLNSNRVSTYIPKSWKKTLERLVFIWKCKPKPPIFLCRNQCIWCISIRPIFRFRPEKSFFEDRAVLFQHIFGFSTFIQLGVRAYLEGSEANLRTSWPTPVIILSIFSTLGHCFQHKIMFFNFYSQIFNINSTGHTKKTLGSSEIMSTPGRVNSSEISIEIFNARALFST